MKIGDVVGFVFAQPGNDTTYLLVEGFEDDGRVRCWDLFFGFEIRVEAKKLWPASERELNSVTDFSTKQRRGSYSVRQLVDERRATPSAGDDRG